MVYISPGAASSFLEPIENWLDNKHRQKEMRLKKISALDDSQKLVVNGSVISAWDDLVDQDKLDLIDEKVDKAEGKITARIGFLIIFSCILIFVAVILSLSGIIPEWFMMVIIMSPMLLIAFVVFFTHMKSAAFQEHKAKKLILNIYYCKDCDGLKTQCKHESRSLEQIRQYVVKELKPHSAAFSHSIPEKKTTDSSGKMIVVPAFDS